MNRRQTTQHEYTITPTCIRTEHNKMNDNNEEEPLVDVNGGMSYIDRLVYELEDESSDDESNTNPDTAGVYGDDTGRGRGEDDDDDNDDWIYPEEEESTDDELEYDYDNKINEDFISDMFYNSTKSPLAFNFTKKANLSEESKDLLLWRLDKDENFSDWTIQVSSTTNNEESIKKTYHVHKTTLGLGPKKSSYFEALLSSGQFSESSNSTSEVELPEDTAKYFDVFLDYMYTHPSECACLINKDNRYALQYLARYFLVPKLTEDILNFIRRDIQNFKNMEEYLTEFGAEDEESRKMLSFAAQVCVKNICNIEVGSSLNYTLTPAILLYMISTIRTKVDLYDSQRYHICRLATEYVKYHHTKLDVNYFVALTSELYFPDDIISAGDMAYSILSIIELMGWEAETITEGIKSACDVLLSRYFRDKVDRGDIPDMATNLPKTSVSYTLVDALKVDSKKRFNTRTKRVTTFDKVSCKIMSLCFGRSLGAIFEVSFTSIDTIDYIRYLISHHLNMLGHMDKVLIWNGDKYLHGPQLVWDCRIFSDTVLEIYYKCNDDNLNEDEEEGGRGDNDDEDGENEEEQA